MTHSLLNPLSLNIQHAQPHISSHACSYMIRHSGIYNGGDGVICSMFSLHAVAPSLIPAVTRAQAHFNLGNVFRQCGHFEAAVYCYEMVVDAVPGHWRVAAPVFQCRSKHTLWSTVKEALAKPWPEPLSQDGHLSPAPYTACGNIRALPTSLEISNQARLLLCRAGGACSTWPSRTWASATLARRSAACAPPSRPPVRKGSAFAHDQLPVYVA